MGSDREFLGKFDSYLEAINRALTDSLDTPVPLIGDIMTHSLLGEGKRLRPLIFVLCAQLCGYDKLDLYRFSTVFEYVHTASLLHDDVLDNAETRRKRPAVRNIWGNSAAVLSGDYFYAKASTIALECRNSEVIRILSDATIRMVEGQILELDHTNDWNIRKEEYMEIIVSKTAELMAAACTCGGVIAGVGNEAVAGLNGFGLNLGIAFQLIDDLLDYFSCEEEFGKPVGKDLREGKITLPLIYTLDHLGSEKAKRLAGPFRDKRATDREYSDAILLVRNSGVKELVHAEARRYAELAARSLDVFPDCPLKRSLLDLNSSMVERSF